jgi:hypothetical protein
MWIADLVALRFEDWNGFLRLAGVRVHVQLLLARLENVRRLRWKKSAGQLQDAATGSPRRHLTGNVKGKQGTGRRNRVKV